MDIYKVAQGGDPNQIIVRLKTDKKTGEFTATVLGHTGEASCADGLDDDLMRDLLEAEVEGFGNMATITDSGKTSEGMESKYRPNTGHQIDLTEDEEEDEEDMLGTPGKKQKMDAGGFGV